MRIVYTALIIVLVPTLSMAHGGKDPVKELEKNRARLTSTQVAFDQLAGDQERIESLETQTDYLLKNVLILRKLMVAEYPHVKTGMSKYKLDYIGILDDSLKEFKVTLKQMKTTLPD